MRDASKAISFGMLYGITEHSLSPRLDITVEEARDLMELFFLKLPDIKRMMDSFGDFAINEGYIIEPILGRVRNFEKWKIADSSHHNGVRRQAMNFPIQAAGSALLKIAVVLLRRSLNHLNLNNKAQILMPYHDEISIQATPEVSEQCRLLLQESMVNAAKIAGYPLLGATAKKGTSWYDTH